MSSGSLKVIRGRSASTIFCDDVRQEVNGKGLFVGVYSSEIIVPELPVTLPTFSAFVNISTPIEQPFRHLAVRLFYEDQVLAEAIIPEDVISASFSAKDPLNEVSEVDSFRVSRTTLVMNVSPLVLDKRGLLKVRVETESEIIPAGALMVSLASIENVSGS